MSVYNDYFLAKIEKEIYKGKKTFYAEYKKEDLNEILNIINKSNKIENKKYGK